MVELGLLDIEDASAESSACGMPVATQIARLEAALRNRIGDDFDVLSVDLLGLDAIERPAALDAIVVDEPSPYVFVGGRMVCSGSVDVTAVLQAIGEA